MSGNSNVSLVNAIQGSHQPHANGSSNNILVSQSVPMQDTNVHSVPVQGPPVQNMVVQSNVESKSIVQSSVESKSTALRIPPTELQITDEHVKKIMASMQSVMNGKTLTKSNILTVVVHVYAVANSMVDLTPSLRQTVIVNALENIIDQQDLSEEETVVLNFMVQEIVGKFLNIVSDIKNGDLKLKLPKCSQCNSCCTIA